MDKKEISEKLTDFYNRLEEALSDETVITIGKVLGKLRDEIGDFSSELEDEVKLEKDSESKENDND